MIPYSDPRHLWRWGDNERRRLARQECLKGLLRGWLYVHVPLSAALMMIANTVSHCTIDG